MSRRLILSLAAVGAVLLGTIAVLVTCSEGETLVDRVRYAAGLGLTQDDVVALRDEQRRLGRQAAAILLPTRMTEEPGDDSAQTQEDLLVALRNAIQMAREQIDQMDWAVHRHADSEARSHLDRAHNLLILAHGLLPLFAGDARVDD